LHLDSPNDQSIDRPVVAEAQHCGASRARGSAPGKQPQAIRLLHVAQPTDAGVAAVVSRLVEDQARRSFQVSLACPSAGGLAESAKIAGAVHYPWSARRAPGPATVGEIRHLSQIVREVDPTVVILHSAKAGLAGRLAIRDRLPTVYVPHAWSFQAVRGLLHHLALVWERIAQRWTALTVCVCEDERSRGFAQGICHRSIVIRNGVDLQAFRPRDIHEARFNLGIEEAPTVVCVGRLARQKGQDLLLAAWPHVRAAVPNANLLLVGDGPERQHLSAHAPAGVQFAGSRPDVASWYAAADVVVLPSRWETMSLVSLEAMACGRSVVSFGFDGATESIGEAGAIVPIGDIRELAVAIIDRLTDLKASAAEGVQARDRAEQIGDVQVSLDAWDSQLRIMTGCK
jgi:glycosyltransferase involved in cell wall biosynthesis